MGKDFGPLTAAELSQILDISEFTIKRLARTKQLPCEYEHNRPRFNLEVIIAYFRELEGGAG
jgi:hypothetical protein